MATAAISISEAFRAGATGYVVKQPAADELRLAIETVLANNGFSLKMFTECGRPLSTNGSGLKYYSSFQV